MGQLICWKFLTLPHVKEKFIILGENESDLAVDTLSVMLTAKTLKLPETRKWLLQEELKMIKELHRI